MDKPTTISKIKLNSRSDIFGQMECRLNT